MTHVETFDSIITLAAYVKNFAIFRYFEYGGEFWSFFELL